MRSATRLVIDSIEVNAKAACAFAVGVVGTIRLRRLDRGRRVVKRQPDKTRLPASRMIQ